MNQKEQRKAQAAADFEEVAAMAEANGVVLIQRSLIHYQLRDVNSTWLINLYPTTGRVVVDKQHAIVPVFEPPADWTLALVAGMAANI